MNFIVLSAKRSGSTFLQEALTSHPNIKCYDEMFMLKSTKTGKRRGQYLYPYMKKNHGYNVKQYVNWIHETKPRKSVGFRLMYPHNDKWKVLNSVSKKIPIIHLYRENLLKMVLSKKTKNLFEKKKQYFDPANILSEIKNIEDKQKRYFDIIDGRKNLLTLKYEDIVGRTEGEKGEIKKFGAFNLRSEMYTYVPYGVCEQICNFLGEEVQELYTNVTKKNSNNPWDYISNKDEMIKALEDAGYERFV